MPDEPLYRKNPSAADLMRKRAADQAANAADRAAREAALLVVERWNAERSPLWSPTIRCAFAAGTPWLDIYCPGCQTSRAIDIRNVNPHPLASIGSLVLGLRCSWCPGNPPMPVLTGLHALPPSARRNKSTSPMEFLHNRPLSPEDLEVIRREIEAMDDIAAVDDEIRGIVARNWPHLLSELPPPPEED